jgi:hypothetical protein
MKDEEWTNDLLQRPLYSVRRSVRDVGASINTKRQVESIHSPEKLVNIVFKKTNHVKSHESVLKKR